MQYHLYILAPIIFVAIVSCGGSIDNDIKNLLDTRKSAFEEKNAEDYGNLIITSYQAETRDGNKTKEDVLKDFRLNTTPFDSIEMSHSDRKVTKEGNEAKVVQKTIVLLQIEEQKTTYEITEVITLEKENGEWKISKESNLDLFRGFVFGKQN